MLDRSIPLSKLKEITSIVMHAASADTFEQALQRIADATRELVQARYAALGVPDGHGGLTHFRVSGLTPEQIEKIAHPPMGRGLLGAIMEERKPIMVNRITDDPRSSGFPHGHPPMDSFLGVPIKVGDELFGMLYLTDRLDGESFSQEDQWLVETMAGYAALAIAGRNLHDKNRQLTLLKERQRIGMALHDGVIQSLYALGMHLDMIRTRTDVPSDTFKPVIDGLNGVIEDIRDHIMNLRRRDNENWTYRALMEDVVSHLYIPQQMRVVINAPDRPVPMALEDAESVCMIVREALSNAVRHAGACTVTITVWYYPDSLKIIVTDDGEGFDFDALTKNEGLGVRNMHERAHLHGGTLEVTSMVNVGTTVTLFVPFQSPESGFNA